MRSNIVSRPTTTQISEYGSLGSTRTKTWQSSMEILNKKKQAKSDIFHAEYDQKLLRLKAMLMLDNQTENEAKASKLNRTEQTELNTVKSQVWKESLSYERQYSQSVRQFRAHSARVFRNAPISGFQRSPTLESFPREKLLQRRKSQNRDTLTPSHCVTCGQIQGVIRAYEKETTYSSDFRNSSEKDESRVHQTVCLFNDRQMKTFIHSLETEYCSGMPDVTQMIQDSKFYLQQNPADTGRIRPQSYPMEMIRLKDRVTTFCRSQDKFNKQHPIPGCVKMETDKARIDLAVSIRKRR
ncbi:uncharacterized protein LOC133186132 [Saccostrea echinata]|uniref:uncharacterized protein LOC133186132 n=1 Tax=Saccostrea echinata TaxID=191078 RepID=UPI002A80C0DA|nr:uncharacterized protein LOC133186132 [Saccostrea echinata]